MKQVKQNGVKELSLETGEGMEEPNDLGKADGVNGNHPGANRTPFVIKAQPETNLDPISRRALEKIKKDNEYEEGLKGLLDHLREYNLESDFMDVVKAINKDARLTEAERQVLKVSYAKVAKEYLEKSGKGAPFAYLKETINAIESSINGKENSLYSALTVGNAQKQKDAQAILDSIKKIADAITESINGKGKGKGSSLWNRLYGNKVQKQKDDTALRNVMNKGLKTITDAIMGSINGKENSLYSALTVGNDQKQKEVQAILGAMDDGLKKITDAITESINGKGKGKGSSLWDRLYGNKVQKQKDDTALRNVMDKGLKEITSTIKSSIDGIGNSLYNALTAGNEQKHKDAEALRKVMNKGLDEIATTRNDLYNLKLLVGKLDKLRTTVDELPRKMAEALVNCYLPKMKQRSSESGVNPGNVAHATPGSLKKHGA